MRLSIDSHTHCRNSTASTTSALSTPPQKSSFSQENLDAAGEKVVIPQTPQKRLAWVDIAKGIGIILVIAGHTLQPDSPYVQIIFLFHMPLFFVLAGYTFKPKPMKTILISSAKRLLIPYMLLFFLWQIYEFFIQADPFTSKAIADCIRSLIYASGGNNAEMGIIAVGMPWFLVCLFLSRISFNALILLFQHKNCPLVLQALIFCICATLGVYIGSSLHLFLPFDLDLALVTIGFMWCGYLARQKHFFESIGMRWYTVAIALILFIVAFRFSRLELATRIYQTFPLCLIGALAGSYLTCWISQLIERYSRLLTKLLAYLGHNSMLLYCIHSLDWLIPWRTFPALENIPLRGFIATFLRTLYAVMFALLVKRI